MSNGLEAIKQEVWSQLKEAQTVYLATAEADQPRVRPITLLDLDEKFWIATGTRSAKARQMLRNPNVEFCLPLSADGKTGYVRVAGVANVVKDPAIRNAIGGRIPFLMEHWTGAGDPSFSLFRITRVEVEYLRPGDHEAITFVV